VNKHGEIFYCKEFIEKKEIVAANSNYQLGNEIATIIPVHQIIDVFNPEK
jgi:hypothetical protein